MKIRQDYISKEPKLSNFGGDMIVSFLLALFFSGVFCLYFTIFVSIIIFFIEVIYQVWNNTKDWIIINHKLLENPGKLIICSFVIIFGFVYLYMLFQYTQNPLNDE